MLHPVMLTPLTLRTNLRRSYYLEAVLALHPLLRGHPRRMMQPLSRSPSAAATEPCPALHNHSSLYAQIWHDAAHTPSPHMHLGSSQASPEPQSVEGSP